MKPRKAILAALTLLSCAAFCACAEQPAAPSEPEAEVSGTAGASGQAAVLTTEYLLDIDLTLPDGDQKNMLYMFFVKKDGTVLTTQYNTDSGNDFYRKKALLDPVIFDLAEPMQELGRLTEEETQRFTEAVSAIDPEGKRYQRDANEPEPDVEETFHLNYNFYLPGQTTQFVALSRGEQKGTSIRSEDPNAAAAVKQIEDSALFQQWMQAHISENHES